MFRKRVIDREGRPGVEFIMRHVLSCDAESRTEERWRRRWPRRPRVATLHDGGVLQRHGSPVLRCVCLAQRPMMRWPTPWSRPCAASLTASATFAHAE